MLGSACGLLKVTKIWNGKSSEPDHKEGGGGGLGMEGGVGWRWWGGSGR